MTSLANAARAALTVAGSDPSGGAGLQADLKTFHQHRVYGAAVVTVLTVQNTVGVSAVVPVDPALVGAQIEAVVSDLDVRAAKTGALGSAEVVEAVAAAARRFPFPLVVDPVLRSKHGAPLLDEAAARVLARELLPCAALVTPNAHEAAVLARRPVRDLRDAHEAARAIADLGPAAVLVKGGHLDAGPVAVDVLRLPDGTLVEVAAPRVDTTHTHGTGCTYSAAITAHLARGVALTEAVGLAKRWLTAALLGARAVGRGIGPVDHLAPVEGPLPRGG